MFCPWAMGVVWCSLSIMFVAAPFFGSIQRFFCGVECCLRLGLLFLAFQGTAFAADSEAFLGFNAEYHYRTEYPGLKGHKAFAIGPQSIYGYSWGARSSKEAANTALKFCNEGVADQKKYGTSGKCRLYAVDGKLLTKDPRIGLPWQKPADGRGYPSLEGSARVSISKFTVSRPCGELCFTFTAAMVWVGASMQKSGDRTFNALGYSFFAPDSFAEPRPAAVCGDAWRARRPGIKPSY